MPWNIPLYSVPFRKIMSYIKVTCNCNNIILKCTRADPEFCKGGVLVNGNDIYCAQHNEHAKHANARGVWGHAPPGKFEKLVTQILNLVGFEHKSLTYI